MDFLTFILIWLAGWFITTLTIVLVKPPSHDKLPYVVFVPSIIWPLVAIILFPLYLFEYILYLRNRYL